MSVSRDARQMLEVAEHAATVGDLASADQLLRSAARIQEAELGPFHPDLANTLNNLAIIAEKTGRSDDAETFYRRAAAIASASLPADHPMVTASRQNLEDFCRSSGLPIDAPAFMTISEQEVEAGLDVFAPEDPAGAATTRNDERANNAGVTTAAATAAALSTPSARPPQTGYRFAWVAIGIVMFASAAAVFATRPWPSNGTPRSASTAASTTSQPASPTIPPPTERPAITAAVQGTPPTVDTRGNERDVVIDTASTPAPAVGDVSLATVQLCQSLSTGGGNWRCDAAGDSTAAGSVVFYTRVRSPRDVLVEHRWYRGDTLRKTVPLTIRASATEGYRTYSRQTVDAGADWRVEIRTADGDLLHEQRFAVQ